MVSLVKKSLPSAAWGTTRARVCAEIAATARRGEKRMSIAPPRMGLGPSPGAAFSLGALAAGAPPPEGREILGAEKEGRPMARFLVLAGFLAMDTFFLASSSAPMEAASAAAAAFLSPSAITE